MEARELVYVQGNALHTGLLARGVSRFHADQWYSVWCAEVQDTLDEGGSPDQVVTKIVQCMTAAFATAQTWGRP